MNLSTGTGSFNQKNIVTKLSEICPGCLSRIRIFSLPDQNPGGSKKALDPRSATLIISLRNLPVFTRSSYSFVKFCYLRVYRICQCFTPRQEQYYLLVFGSQRIIANMKRIFSSLLICVACKSKDSLRFETRKYKRTFCVSYFLIGILERGTYVSNCLLSFLFFNIRYLRAGLSWVGLLPTTPSEYSTTR